MSHVSRVTWPTSAAATGSRQGHVIAGLPWPLLIIRVPHCVMSGNFPVAADIMTLLRWHYHIILRLQLTQFGVTMRTDDRWRGGQWTLSSTSAASMQTIHHTSLARSSAVIVQ